MYSTLLVVRDPRFHSSLYKIFNCIIMASNRYVCEQNLVFIKDLAASQSGPLLFNTINSYIAEFQKNNRVLKWWVP